MFGDNEEEAKERRKRVHLSSYGGSPPRVTIENVPTDEIQGVVNGCLWFGVTDGKAEFHPRYHPLPPPKDDEQLLPFWTGKHSYKYHQFDQHSYSPSIIIQSLCGYNYTPQRYEEAAKQLTSWGFECLRSQRGKNGRFWEMWFLGGEWAAKGKLKEHIESLPKYDHLKDVEQHMSLILRWISRNTVWGFGTLDTVSHRMAMSMDD